MHGIAFLSGRTLAHVSVGLPVDCMPSRRQIARFAAHCALHYTHVTASMAVMARDIYVLGIGQLAAAVRSELLRRGLLGEAAHESVPYDKPPLVVACSDYQNI